MKSILRPLIMLCGFYGGFGAHALTLDEAVKYATESSHEIKELRFDYESADWKVKKALSGFLPKLDLEGRHLFKEKFQELDFTMGGVSFTMPVRQPYSILGLNASLNLFDGFRTTNEFSAAKLEKQAAENRLKRAIEQKQAEIRTLFYKALGSQVLVEVANQNIQTLESHMNDVNARIRSGVSTRFDFLRVEVQLEDAKTEKVAAENNVAIARSKLIESIGIADDEKPLVGDLPDEFIRLDLAKVTFQIEDRADRAALIASRDQTEKLVAAAKSHWLPTFSLFGNYEWYNNLNSSITEEDAKFKNAYAVGFKLSWNLFDGGGSYARQQQSLVTKKIAEERLAKLDESLAVSLDEIKRRLIYDITNYKTKLSSIKKAEEAVRLAKGGLRAGARTNTEILDAVLDLNRTKAAMVRSKIDAIEALGLLELAVGHAL